MKHKCAVKGQIKYQVVKIDKYMPPADMCYWYQEGKCEAHGNVKCEHKIKDTDK